MCAAAGYGSGGTCSATAANLATIEGLINLAISETNTAYVNSGIPMKLRLVKTHFEATYDDYGNGWETTLANLKGTSDGYMDYVDSMRNQYGADFVNLMVDTGSYCGIGYRPDVPSADQAFSLTKWSCATGYYSFGHELAHNMVSPLSLFFTEYSFVKF
jgi:peptidyl-Asp metalloendopeptidase